MTRNPKRRLHRLRGGDGPPVPEVEPPELWPQMEELDAYWESFQAFARSEMPGDAAQSEIEFSFHMDSRSGEWRFEAFQSTMPDENYGGSTQTESYRLTYDPAEDQIEMEMNTLKGETGWVMEDAFGKPLSATSAL